MPTNSTQTFNISDLGLDSTTPIRFGDRTSKPAVIGDDVEDILGTLNGIAAAHGTEITSGQRTPINYGAGANSAHGKGKAADFRTHNLSREQGDALIEDLKAQGFWVNDERDNWKQKNPKTGKQRGTGPHIHAEWRGDTAMGGVAEEPSVSTATGSMSSDTFSLSDLGVSKTVVPAPRKVPAPLEKPKETGLIGGLKAWWEDQTSDGSAVPKFIYEPLEEKIDQVSRHLSTRWKSMTGQLTPDDPDYNPPNVIFGSKTLFPTIEDYERNDPNFAKRIAKRESDRLAKAGVDAAFDGPPPKGFVEQLKSRSVVDLILNDSLPANAIEWAGRQDEKRYKKLIEARDNLRQEQVVAHPEQFSATEVQAAREAITQRKTKQGRGIAEAWNDLKTAAKEDPGKFGAQLLQALIADPEMLAVPIGLGARPVQAVQAARGATVASKAAKIADRLIDVGTTGGGLNVAIEAAQRGSEGEDFTGRQAASSFAIGAGLALPFGIFGKGAEAASKLKAGEVNAETLDTILRDVAKDDLSAETIINSSDPIDRSVKHRIEESTGIKFESDADLKAYLEIQRKEWKALFKERDLNGQYQSALADERINRRQTLLEEQQTREARQAAEAEKAREVDAAYAEDQAAKLSRLNDNYEKALAARDAAKAEQSDAMWQREADLRDAESAISQQEILDAAMSKDVPAIRNAMLRAAQRDSKLRVPKWQRGEIDPKLLARLGVGSLFAGTAYAAADEDSKLRSAAAAGLAGLIIPGGGSVLSRMRQSGAVSSDGALLDTISYLIKEGKLSSSRDVAEQMARDADAIQRAKEGSQQAFGQLYKDHAPKLQRIIAKQIKGIAGRLGIDAEDVVMDVFSDAFTKIDNYKGDVPFSAYLHSIARNKVVDYIREAQTLKGGRDIQTTSMYSAGREFGDSARAGQITEGDISAIKNEVEGAASDLDTPEGMAIQDEVSRNLPTFLESLPERQRKSFLLNRADEYTAQQIAEMTNQNLSTVLMQIKGAQDKFVEWAANGYQAVKERPAVTQPTGEFVKRGRGRPRKQAGEVDPELLKNGAKLAVAGLAGLTAANLFVDNKDAEGNIKPDKEWSPLISGVGTAALAAFAMFTKGRHGSLSSSVRQAADELLGSSSTRILNKSQKVFGALQSTIRSTATETHKYIETTTPFLKRLNKMPKDTQDIIARALYTGKSSVINKLLEAIGDKELTESYKAIRSTLDSLGDKLVNLKRFSKGAFEYFPRIIKDKEGLFKAIGKTKADDITKILDEANVESLKKSGKPLTGFEENALINSILFGGEHKNLQPGWAKNRGIEEITEELLPFYATPAESLHSYIRSAVADIEKAKFFGKNARNMKQGKHEFLDVDASVGLMMRDELASGKLSQADANDVAGIIKDFFGKGQMGESDWIRKFKDLSYVGLLGNFLSTMTQLADIPVAIYTQDLRSTIGAVVRQATGRKLLSAKELGLIDNVSQEFAGQNGSTRALNKILKGTLFSHVDQMGKNTAINAAVIRAQRLANSENGVLKLSSKYGEIFGDKFPALVSDLKAGRISDVVKDYAWMELSRTQPISMLEMPQVYMKHPNARSYLMLKSFVLKQVDMVRRDAIQNMASKDPRKIAKGIKNLTEMTIVMGAAGAGTQMVKDWLQGKDVKFELTDIPLNMVKNLGWSEYQLDKFRGVSREEAARRRQEGEKNTRAQEAHPILATAELAVPPFRIFEDVLRGDPNSIRYVVPGIGPWLAQKLKDSEEMKQEVANE